VNVKSQDFLRLAREVSRWLVQLVVQIHMATILSTPPPHVDISEQPEEFKQSKMMSVELLMIQIDIRVATPRFLGKALGLQEDVRCITSSRGFWLCL
jgi:hypothetical protein